MKKETVDKIENPRVMVYVSVLLITLVVTIAALSGIDIVGVAPEKDQSPTDTLSLYPTVSSFDVPGDGAFWGWEKSPVVGKVTSIDADTELIGLEVTYPPLLKDKAFDMGIGLSCVTAVAIDLDGGVLYDSVIDDSYGDFGAVSVGDVIKTYCGNSSCSFLKGSCELLKDANSPYNTKFSPF